MSKPLGYTRTQIGLHWAIALVIAEQFLLNEPMSEAWDLVEKGQVPSFTLMVFGHVAGGVLVLLLAIWRISIKVKRGSPDLPENESKLQKILAHATHGFLYLLMILVPVSGLSAWFGGIEAAADGHEVLTTVLLILIALHFAAALYHRFVLKSGVMERMLKPES